ncbi:MAG TPA: hypothetical protein VGF76_26110 [Polyangiaceae bacterium]
MLAYGCSASNDDNAGQAGGGGSGGIAEAGSDEAHFGTDGSPPDQDGSLPNPLCGVVVGGCVPDDGSMACTTYVPPPLPNGDGGPLPNPPDNSAQAGAAGAAGEGGGGFSSGRGGDGGFGAGVSASLAGEGGTSPSDSGGATGGSKLTFGCQVQRSPDARQSVVSQCAVLGPGGNNAPCLTSSDCQAGFGCVGDQASGLCQRYCCQDADACGTDTYCTERPLRDAVTNAASSATASPLLIPVCVPAENCDLSAPYPCTAGTQCACKTGTACLVVRSDGTTTCAVPGKGKAGEACPCAWDHVCSAATNECLKLCPTSGVATCDNGGKCQSAAELPDGWGVCVGATR